jgi:hypothetical protein
MNMLYKIGGGGCCAVVAVFYFFANQMTTDEDFPVFVVDGEQHTLSITHHPDRTKFATLYDQHLEAYATTEWFRVRGELIVDCERPATCRVVTENEPGRPIRGYELIADARAAVPLTDEQWYSERTFGFEQFTTDALEPTELRTVGLR